MRLDKATKLAEEIRDAVLEAESRYSEREWEVKEFSIRPLFDDAPEREIWWVSITVGMVGDEGSLAQSLCRPRRLVQIGKRGGLRLGNAKHKTRSRGWFNVVHGQTKW